MTTAASTPWTAHYSDGVPAQIPEPTESLIDVLDASIMRYRAQVALQFFGAETTYAELGEQIRRAAEGLRKLGVRPGDRVALVLPNCPQHVVAFYAVLRLGAIVVEHNPMYTAREMRHQFEDHGATVAIVWSNTAPMVQSLPADAAVDTVVSVDVTRAMPMMTRAALRLPLPSARAARAALTRTTRGTVSWEELLAGRALSKQHPRPQVHDDAVLQYTSGTTGRPKGARLTHFNLVANAAQGRAWVPGIREGDETVYAVLPMFHAYGLTLCLSFAMSIGARLVLFPKFDEKMVLDAARKHPPTFLPAVPPIYQRLAVAAKKRKISLRAARFSISGAMTLPPSTVELWEATTGGLLIEGYGLTETSPICLGNPMGETRRPGTVGVPFPSTTIRVVDPDNVEHDVARSEPGELLVHGPQVFAGYWKRPEETAEVLLDGGWLRTGDIVTVDEDGFVTIVDRIKELIITGGFNVSPSEVEETLRQHDSVSDAAVVGLPTADGGEEVVAAVVMNSGATLDEENIRTFCRSTLAAYKVPRRVVEMPDLPTSLIGKVLRREVRRHLLGEPEED